MILQGRISNQQSQKRYIVIVFFFIIFLLILYHLLKQHPGGGISIPHARGENVGYFDLFSIQGQAGEAAGQQDHNQPLRGRFGYVTSVTTSSYVDGALVLGQSLRETRSPYDRIALISKDIGQSDQVRLGKVFSRVLVVENIESPFAKQIQSRWETTFTKLRIWNLSQYDKLVFLDSDIVVLKNIDELFLRPQLSAALDCCDHFNTGVMVLVPNRATFQHMISSLSDYESYDKSDQGWLNSYFRNNFYPLPFKYNVDQMTYLNTPHGINREDITILHYVHYKPWNMKEFPLELKLEDDKKIIMKELHSYWWNVRNRLD